MRKMILTLIFVHSISLLFSQNNRKVANNEENIKRNIALKEESGAIVDENNWTKLNPIAQKAYSKSQAARMPAYKLIQVNYLYSESYKINHYSACQIDREDIKFSEIFTKRAESDDIEIPLTTKDGCSYSIKLFSLEKINKEFTRIEKDNK